MHLLCLLVVAGLVTLLHAAATASQATRAADPMASFARLVGGSWRVEFESGTSQHDVWTWGPGRRSLQRN